MSSLKAQAEKDAREWTQAKLAYGEGAGTRRKLINETVAYKMQHIAGYEDAFANAAEHQDVASLAKHAKRDARRKNVNQALVRNTKAMASGKYENLNTALLIVGGAAVVMHKTGLDKVAIRKTKDGYREMCRRLRRTPKAPKGPQRGHDGVIFKIHSMD